MAILNAPHVTVTTAQLRRIGADVGEILRTEAARNPRSQRSSNALSLLAHFPKHGEAILCREALTSTRNTARRRMAIRGCARIGGGKALATLSTTLHDRDLYIREATVYGLRDQGGQAARKLLESRRLVEKNAMIRTQIDRALKAVAGSTNPGRKQRNRAKPSHRPKPSHPSKASYPSKPSHPSKPKKRLTSAARNAKK